MLGWLVVNSFIHSEKFNKIYDFLNNSSLKFNINLEIRTTDSLLCDLKDDFTNYNLPDFVLFWDKDIYLAQRLEKIGLKLFNSAKAIEICDNKILTYQCLADKFNIPKTIIAPKTFEGINYNNKDFLKTAIKILGFPFVIKEAYGSFGKQVYLVNDYDEAVNIIEKLGYKDFLMQEFIQTSIGRDIRINIVNKKVVSSMLRYNPNDFKSNITNGGHMKKYDISNDQRDIAIEVCQKIGLDFGGVDILFGKNDVPIICEVNSNPHFKSTLECTGKDMSYEILKYIVEKIS